MIRDLTFKSFCPFKAWVWGKVEGGEMERERERCMYRFIYLGVCVCVYMCV